MFSCQGGKINIFSSGVCWLITTISDQDLSKRISSPRAESCYWQTVPPQLDGGRLFGAFADIFYKKSRNSETKSRKIDPKVQNGHHVLATTGKSCANKKVPFSQMNISLLANFTKKTNFQFLHFFENKSCLVGKGDRIYVLTTWCIGVCICVKGQKTFVISSFFQFLSDPSPIIGYACQ